MKVSIGELKAKFPAWEFKNFTTDASFMQLNHDSRTISQNELYVPIVGETHNGHSFIDAALAQGAAGSFCQLDKLHLVTHSAAKLIIVPDSEIALADLVGYIREKINISIISIGGTTGKTTTRGLLASILSVSHKVLNAERNINTLWGNAQILMRHTNETFWPIEIAMDRMAEIKWQAEAIRPDLAILVTIGETHAERVGGAENVYLAETEILDYMYTAQRPAVLNIADPKVARAATEYRDKLTTITVGEQAEYQVSAIKVTLQGTTFNITHQGTTHQIALAIPGKEYAYDAALAIAAARYFEISWQDIKLGLTRFHGVAGRFEEIKLNEYCTVIDDAYNANPHSMALSLNTLNSLYGHGDNVHLFLGNMNELAETTESAHQELAGLVKKIGFQHVNFTGDFFPFFNYGAQVSLDEAKKGIKDIASQSLREKQPTYILLKASNGVGLASAIA